MLGRGSRTRQCGTAVPDPGGEPAALSSVPRGSPRRPSRATGLASRCRAGQLGPHARDSGQPRASESLKPTDESAAEPQMKSPF